MYEVYDPAKVRAVAAADAATANNASTSGLKARPSVGGVRVLTSIQFLSGGSKVYETPLVAGTSVNVPERGAVGFEFDVPLNGLKPGIYVCQVNVIDDAGGTFSFPRMALRVLAPSTPAIAAQPIPGK